MKECTVKLFGNARAPAVISLDDDESCPILVAAARSGRGPSASDGSRTSMLMKLAWATIIPLFAAFSLLGCQISPEPAIAAEAAKSRASNISTRKSDWPKMVTIPSGTTLLISLNTTLRTDREKSGDIFVARLYDAVRVDQTTVLPAGTEVWGRLIVVAEPYHSKGKARMTLLFNRVVDPSGRILSISTAPIVLVGDEEKVAAGAVIGGVIGALSSNNQRAKGAAGGGAIALLTKSKQIELPSNQHFAVDLDESLRVSVAQLTAGR